MKWIHSLWLKYKNLQWYWKILLVIPFILLLVWGILKLIPEKSLNLSLLKDHKKAIDYSIENTGESIIGLEAEVEKIEKAINKIDSNIIESEDNIHSNNEGLNETFKKIDNTNGINNLSKLANDIFKSGRE